VRHVLGPAAEDLEEGEWNLAAAETAINRIFPGESIANGSREKAWAFPCSKIKPF
jgi:hypothetical protein